jgi:hypothetical protein
MADHHEFDLREFWRAVAETLLDPRRLKIGGNGMRLMTGEGAELFWRAAIRFHQVDYHGEDFLDVFSRSTLDCSRIYHLSYDSRDVINVNLERQLEFFKSCRSLTKLCWNVSTDTFPLNTLLQLLEQEVWPDLEDLYMGTLNASDESLATVLGRLPALKHFGLGSGDFGPLCFNQLRRHFFGFLKSLDLRGCRDFTGLMALEVLANCHHLEQFKAVFIFLKDLQSASRPWVCERLRHLAVCFARECDDGPLDALFFEHLSRLRCLETIDVRRPYVNPKAQRIMPLPLRWKLESGLAQLATLKNLKSLNFEGIPQELCQEDLEWMVNHWPLLGRLLGSLVKDWVDDRRWDGWLERQGISRRLPVKMW